MVSLVAPQKLNDVQYDVLVRKLETHLCPKKNVFVLQHRFLSTYQGEDQTLSEYVALLRRDLNECEFVSTCDCKADISNIFLRAQFIRGVKDVNIREQLLQSEEPDFDKIFEKALSLEASRIDSRELDSKNSSGTSSVNKIRSRSTSGNRRRQFHRSSSRGSTSPKSKVNFSQLGIDSLCIRCGRNNHKVKDCRTNPKRLKCRACGKTGHVKQVCIKTLLSTSNNNSIETNDEYEEAIFNMHGINKIIDIHHNQPYDRRDDDKYMTLVLSIH
ncbi:uncharacterized protein [Musca autumnalis]|uniref:uncharacterized protein n=1 Tax=Musca autumnalis TaxID=221902 RepID=UPI003CED84A0